MAPSTWIPSTRTPLICCSRNSRVSPCRVPASRMPVTPAVAERVPESVRSGKIKCFLIVTMFVGHRIARQPSALRTVVRPDVRLSIGSVRQGRPTTVFREPQVQRRARDPEAPSSLCQVSIAGVHLGQNCLALGLTQIPKDLFGSQPVKLGMSIFRLFDIRQQTFAADTHPSRTDEAAGTP